MGVNQSYCLAPRTSSLPRHPASKIESAATIRDDLRDAFEKIELRVEHLIPLLNFIDQAIKTLEGAGTSQSDAVQSEKSDIAQETLNLAQSLVQHVAEECKTAQEQAVGTDTKNLFFTKAFGSAMTQAFGQILGKLGTLHWAVCVLSLVGYLFTQKQLVAENRDAMLDILKRMHNLAENIFRLIPQFARPGGDVMLKKAVYEVATGVIACCSTDRSHRLYSYFFASVDQGTLSEIGRKLTQINEEITRNLLIEIVDRLPPAYKPINISLPKHLVGMEKQVEEVIGKIGFGGNSPAHSIVLCGMGGAGKTTLMDAVCDSMRNLGKQSPTIIRTEVGETPKIPKLQVMILEQLTGRAKKVTDAKSGQKYILDELKNSTKPPLLLCIDNVLEGHHLEELLPEDLSLPMGSAILVTARNEAVKSTLGEILGDTPSVLSHKVHLLPLPHAKELVLEHLGQKYWDASMDERLDQLVAACDGHPLALKLAGKYIKIQKGKEEAWEHAIEAMRGMDHTLDGNKENQLVTCLWYVVKNLDDKLRTALLDIVSFFNLSNDFQWEHVKVILGERVFEMLQERALIEAYEQNYRKRVKVHDLIVALVKKRMLPSNDQSRVRSWKDLKPLVGDLQKLGAIEGLDLSDTEGPDLSEIEGPDLSDTEGLDLEVEAIFKAIPHMHSVRLLFLPIGGLVDYSISPRAPLQALSCGCLPCTFPSNAKELTYLQLDMSDLDDQAAASRQLQLFSEAATSLKVVQIRNRGTLEVLPEGPVKNWKQLEELCLLSWRSLKVLPSSFGDLTKLRVLSLRGCGSLESLPQEMGNLNQLQELDLGECSNLKALPSSFGGLTKLRVLSLRICEGLESLPQEMGNLNQLQELNLRFCSNIKALPSSFGGLTALRTLNLICTEKLHAFPQGICAGLKRLEEINLYRSGVRALPSDFCGLNFLKHLRMPSSKLEGFPEGICGGLQSLVTLDLSATKLRALPKDMGSLTALKELLLTDCELLQVFPEGICGGLRSLEHLDLSETKLSVLPADLGCLTAIRVLKVGRCEGLDAFKGAGFKSSLEVLDLSECGNVNKLPFDLKEFASLKELFLFPSSEHQNLMPLENQCNLKMKDFPDVRNKVRQDMVDLEESERRKKGVELLRNAKLIGCDELAVIQPGALNGKVLGLLFAKPGKTYYSDEVKTICEEVAEDAEGKPVQCLLVVDPCAEGGAYFQQMDKAGRAYMPEGWLGVSTWDPETRAALSVAYRSNAIEDAQGSSFVFIDVMEEGGHMQWDAFGAEAYPFGGERMKDRPDDELSLLVEINCVLNHVKILDGVAKTVGEKHVALIFFSLVQQENGSGLKWDLLKYICDSLSEDSAIRIVWIPAPYDGDRIPKDLWPTPWCIYYARGADIMRSVKKLWRQFGFGWHDKQVDCTQRIVMFDREKQTIHRDLGHVLLQHGVDAAFTMDSAMLQLQEEKDWLAPFDNAQSSLGVVLHGCERLLAPKQTQVDISEIQGRPIGLLFLPTNDPRLYTNRFMGWLSNLKATYERMKENDKKFEIIYVTERANSKAFEQAYQGMPWLALSLADALGQRIKWCVARERMRQLLDEDPLKKKWFQLLCYLPYETLQDTWLYGGAQLLVFGADGEPSGGIDPLGCEGFCPWGCNLPRFTDFLQLPPSLQHSSHDRHALIPLNRFAICDICGKDGIGFYTCIECKFDVCIEKCWKT